MPGSIFVHIRLYFRNRKLREGVIKTSVLPDIRFRYGIHFIDLITLGINEYVTRLLFGIYVRGLIELKRDLLLPLNCKLLFKVLDH